MPRHELKEPARGPGDAVGLLEFQDAFVAEVSSDPAVLEAAERRAVVLSERAMAVEVRIAGLQLPGYPQRPVAVA